MNKVLQNTLSNGSLALVVNCYFFVVLLFSTVKVHSQPQDCLNAISVCAGYYEQNNSQYGYGTIQEIIPGQTCLSEGEINSTWYVFKIKQAGSLLFLITPINVNDDYDFAVYDLTKYSCDDIASGKIAPLRCNFSSERQPTGLSVSSKDLNVGTNGNSYCAPLSVKANEVYALMISNFTGTNTGYTLQFSGSATLSDTELPEVDSVAADKCNPRRATMYFSEPMKANSVAADGSDFSIAGPSAITITGASLISKKAVRIVFDTVVATPGTYTISLQRGIDGNTVTDLCDNEVNPGDGASFKIDFEGVKATIVNIKNATCNVMPEDGEAEADVWGGLQPYTLVWNTTPPQTGLKAVNLPPGKYTLKATDAKGCAANVTATIRSTGPTIKVVTTDDDCNNPGIGKATVSVSGGTSPYLYSWSTVPVQTSKTVTGLIGGNYDVTITDAKGCTSSLSFKIDFSGGPALSLTTKDISCDNKTGGSITVTATGSQPFTYLWSNSFTTPSIADLSMGSYSVIVTDVNGCTSFISTTINNGHMNVSTQVTDLVCGNKNTGSISLNISDATPPYTYLWNTKPARTDSALSDLAAGSYKVVITDASGCKESITAVVKGPPPIALFTTTNDANCIQNDGSAFVTATGGVSPFTYSWNTNPPQSTAGVSNLAAGIYTVTVTDQKGCTAMSEAFVGNIGGPDAFISYSKDETCHGNSGEAQVTVRIGKAPFSFEWSCFNCSAPVSNQSLLLHAVAGIYDVKITDVNGCISFLHVKINREPMNPVPVASFTTDPDEIYAETPAHFIYTGTPAVSFQWMINGFGTGLFEPVYRFDRPGTASVSLIITDAKGCTDTAVRDIPINPPVALYIPNSFTPNNDGVNDRFLISGNGIKEFRLQIFNRYGQVVFSTDDVALMTSSGWDGISGGKPVPQDNYAYYLIGTYEGNSPIVRTGTIMVVH